MRIASPLQSFNRLRRPRRCSRLARTSCCCTLAVCQSSCRNHYAASGARPFRDACKCWRRNGLERGTCAYASMPIRWETESCKPVQIEMYNGRHMVTLCLDVSNIVFAARTPRSKLTGSEDTTDKTHVSPTEYMGIFVMSGDQGAMAVGHVFAIDHTIRLHSAHERLAKKFTVTCHGCVIPVSFAAKHSQKCRQNVPVVPDAIVDRVQHCAR